MDVTLKIIIKLRAHNESIIINFFINRDHQVNQVHQVSLEKKVTLDYLEYQVGLASLVWMALKAIVEILEFQADLGNQEKKEIVAPQVWFMFELKL